MSSFTKENYSEYKDKLLNAFPQILKSDVQVVSGIIPFAVNDIELCNGETRKLENLIHPAMLTIQQDSELLKIPYRLYFNEPDTEKESKLSDTQKTILNCIYLKHHNGYLRQRRLEKLIDKSEYWITPYTIQLLGEYVFEILEVLDRHINDKNIDNYKRFVKENPKYFQQTESRMISYWNAYYRRQKFPKLKDYIGYRIVNRIKLVLNLFQDKL